MKKRFNLKLFISLFLMGLISSGCNEISASSGKLTSGIYKVMQIINYDNSKCEGNINRNLCDVQPDLSNSVWVFNSNGDFLWQLEANKSNSINGTWSNNSYEAINQKQAGSSCVSNFAITGIVNQSLVSNFSMISEFKCTSGNNSFTIHDLEVILEKIRNL